MYDVFLLRQNKRVKNQSRLNRPPNIVCQASVLNLHLIKKKKSFPNRESMMVYHATFTISINCPLCIRL